MAAAGRVLVYGGSGALGAACVKHFRAKNWAVTAIDARANDEASQNIVVAPSATWTSQYSEIVAQLSKTSPSFDAIVCVAGGWAGGNAASDLVAAAELMSAQSIATSTISAQLAGKFLASKGLLVLTGSAAALSPTPGMMGYGLAKAAVHHLVRSLGAPEAGLPQDAAAVGILPITLDTPSNRQYMGGDTSSWTPLDYVAGLLHEWAASPGSRPASGSLVVLKTAQGQTTLVPS
eukprot:m.85887 g.85887  ORF g.85887 m.85887 type:complete len:234 (-) comp8257_c0_seq4:1766-2467(-)